MHEKQHDHTISDIAKILRVSRSKVNWLIGKGLLIAYSIPGEKRLTVRITQQALEDFKANNQCEKVQANRRAVKLTFFGK